MHSLNTDAHASVVRVLNYDGLLVSGSHHLGAIKVSGEETAVLELDHEHLVISDEDLRIGHVIGPFGTGDLVHFVLHSFVLLPPESFVVGGGPRAIRVLYRGVPIGVHDKKGPVVHLFDDRAFAGHDPVFLDLLVLVGSKSLRVGLDPALVGHENVSVR